MGHRRSGNRLVHDERDIRRDHSGDGSQRPGAAGLSLALWAQDAVSRTMGRARRGSGDDREPARRGSDAQSALVLSPRPEPDAVVRGPGAGRPWRPLHRAGAECRAADRRGAQLEMVDGFRANPGVIPPMVARGCGRAHEAGRRVPSDRRAHPDPGVAIATTGAVAAAAHAEPIAPRPPVAGSVGALSPGIRHPQFLA